MASTGVTAALLLPKPPEAWRRLQATANASVHDSSAADQAAMSCGSLLLWVLLVWLALALAVMAASALPGRWGTAADTISRIIVPALARRLLCGAVSISLVSGLVAGPAHATQRARSGSTENLSASQPAATARSFDWPPNVGWASNEGWASDFDWPSGGSPPAPKRAADPPPATGQVVVTRGDCLWNVARRSLGATATERAVALEWPRWWERNRDRIGNNPNLIFPGQRLDAPTPR